MTDSVTPPVTPDDDAREPLDERFPALKDIDAMDDGRRIETFRNVLDALRRELDAIGK
ncbi:hypothetical protein [Bifidobacterium saguinibicoloris]|uniref:hypothetical protein n=1 Tax=Bifidobacterium saguinibicoloris TaxID=2834433 RepID=UPI001C573112|nr:hypothetical protein [Bifidobacterium saguinibicoloris]MBW3080702.1 hypothetical protein [Bifidobacterium saguinibicoloris]